MASNVLYGQAGGVTPVINASACGVIETARKQSDVFGHIYAARDGIIGALCEDMFDLDRESASAIKSLYYSPAGAFGACRYDLGSFKSYRHQYERLMDVFSAHDIGYFFYNGGGGSMVTAHKIRMAAEALGYPLTVMGIPKTIDNDLAGTDCSPGFGTTAKYVATATLEATMDVRSMASTSTRVFILEVMGRNAGWLAAASALAGTDSDDAPHLILFAERPFDQRDFLKRVRETVDRVGYCVVVTCEGIRDAQGEPITVAHKSEVKAWVQLGGVAAMLANTVRQELGYKVHWGLPDYLQRAARHVASKTDVEQAYAMGEAAVHLAASGENGRMPVIERVRTNPYEWEVSSTDLGNVADIESKVPDHYITPDGYGITAEAREYLAPLIEGEIHPPYTNGLPDYSGLELFHVEPKLPSYQLDEQPHPDD
ncbi:MAG: 6-phosphofructokinase [Pseudomonadota bacterium]